MSDKVQCSNCQRYDPHGTQGADIVETSTIDEVHHIGQVAPETLEHAIEVCQINEESADDAEQAAVQDSMPLLSRGDRRASGYEALLSFVSRRISLP